MTTVVAHATVVTVDANDRVIDDGAVAFDDDGAITAVGATDDVLAAHPGAAVHDARGGILMPGLVNAHAHLGMTLLRGVADDRDLQGFLDIVVPIESTVLSPDSIRVGTRLAYAESLRAGSTTALDMFWWPEVALEEARAVGFRLITGPTFIGFPGPDQRDFAARREWAAEFHAAPEQHSPKWLQPHSTYTLDPSELRTVLAMADAVGARIHVHASENATEVATVVERYGRTPIEVLDDVGMLRTGTVLAHAVVLRDDEIARIAEAGAAVAHCPLSNLKLASGVCRVPDLLAAGVVVGLGTDGTASSNDLDLFLAMRVAATLHKGVRLDANVLPAAQVLRMATMGSARLMGMDHLIGSIEVGKRADLVLLDADSPALTPSFDATSTIVYAASRGDVCDVWVDARHVVDNRRLTTMDIRSVLDAARAVQREIETLP